ncbi:MAG: hypothetical protein WDN28_08280 [Chthoniobacter sp.]
MTVCLAVPKKPRSQARRTPLNTRSYEYHESVLLAEIVERLAPARAR